MCVCVWCVLVSVCVSLCVWLLSLIKLTEVSL